MVKWNSNNHNHNNKSTNIKWCDYWIHCCVCIAFHPTRTVKHKYLHWQTNKQTRQNHSARKQYQHTFSIWRTLAIYKYNGTLKRKKNHFWILNSRVEHLCAGHFKIEKITVKVVDTQYFSIKSVLSRWILSKRCFALSKTKSIVFYVHRCHL